MADSVQKSISANDIKNGSAVIKTGVTEFQTVDAGPPDIADRSLTQIENKLTDRHDDPQYYTA